MRAPTFYRPLPCMSIRALKFKRTPRFGPFPTSYLNPCTQNKIRALKIKIRALKIKIRALKSKIRALKSKIRAFKFKFHSVGKPQDFTQTEVLRQNDQDLHATGQRHRRERNFTGATGTCLLIVFFLNLIITSQNSEDRNLLEETVQNSESMLEFYRNCLRKLFSFIEKSF